MTAHEIRRMFEHHVPTDGQVADLTEIREAAKRLVETITSVCPPCADTAAAIRKTREAVWTATAAVLREAALP